MSMSVACSPVEFNRNTNNCGGLGEAACKVGEDAAYIDFNYSYTTEKPAVDVLIAIDSTTSMRVEQAKIAQRFSNFLNIIDGLEWRIAITTMDISNIEKRRLDSDMISNSNSYDLPGKADYQTYQDGNLIPFSGGGNWMDKSDSGSLADKQARFSDTIQIDSDFWSVGDERGILSASLSVKNNSGWMRDHAHLAVLFITDEDVRSLGTQPGQYSKRQPSFEDSAVSFKQVVDDTLGANKAVSVYPIIVQSTDASIPSIENGGTKSNSFIQSCLNTQVQQDGVDGAVGYMYEELFQYFEGTTGSICNPNYSSVLSGIANVIDAKTRKNIALPCVPVIDTERGYTFSITSDLPNNTTYVREGSNVIFTPALPPGFTVGFSYTCEEI